MADAQNVLDELKASILFAPDFPRRVSWTNAEWAALSEARKRAERERRREAASVGRDEARHLEGLVQTLGRERYEPSVPALAKLWRECDVYPVRPAAGHALFAIGTEAALDALIGMADDTDHLSRFLGIKAIFARDPLKAYDHFEDRFGTPEGRRDRLAHDVLRFFIPTVRGPGEPNWRTGIKDFAICDPRWLDLCARLRRDPDLGYDARQVLRRAPDDVLKPALARARAEEATLPPPAPPKVSPDGRLVARYATGEYEQVWREIRSYTAIDGEFREEVLEVARATMRRVAENADLLTERLRVAGWRAHLAEYSDLRTPPRTGDAEIMQRIRKNTEGPLPPALEAFWQVVGGINWVWAYDTGDAPDLGVTLAMPEMDPLCIDPPSVMPSLLEEWLEQSDSRHADLIDPFRVALAPDFHFKAGFGGAGPFYILLPFAGADPILEGQRHELPFIDYLRLAFRWAGFPGLEDHFERTDVRRFLAEFSRDLQPF